MAGNDFRRIAILLSGGVGSRMGADMPKQYMEVNGKPVFLYSLEPLISHPDIEAVIIVCDRPWWNFVSSYLHVPTKKPIYLTTQGETRQFSIYNGLIEAERIGLEDNGVVLVHDAAYPMLDSEIISSCLEEMREDAVDAAVSVVDVKNTIYIKNDDGIVSAVPRRKDLLEGQSPEAFRFRKYLDLHNRATREDISKATGGAEFAFRHGLRVAVSKGKESNLKLSTPEDILKFELLLKKNQTVQTL